jgi:hypothetical protein
LLVHVLRLLGETLVFGLATRRLSVVVAVVLGLLLLALVVTAQTVAPVAVYPFA